MRKKKLYSRLEKASLNFGEFIDKKGFYIVILLCLLVIGAAIALVSIRDYQKFNVVVKNDADVIKAAKIQSPAIKNEQLAKNETVAEKANKKEEIKQPEDFRVVSISKSHISKNEQHVSENKSNTLKGKPKNVSTKPKQEADKKDEIVKFDWPVFGKITNKYSPDKLIFSKTLNQWTTHHGVDISSDEGSPVRTAYKGVVKSIKNDPMLGITITIEHENGLKTIYSNLSSASMVKLRQEVERGKVISGVGRTASFESDEPAHIHFEVMKDGKTVDPNLFLQTM